MLDLATAAVTAETTLTNKVLFSCAPASSSTKSTPLASHFESGLLNEYHLIQDVGMHCLRRSFGVGHQELRGEKPIIAVRTTAAFLMT